MNGQHKVFGNKRLSRVVRGRCASDWGDAGSPPTYQSFLAAHQPSPGAPHGSPGAFPRLPPAAVCSHGSARDSGTSAPIPSQAKTVHLQFSSDAVIPCAPSPALLPSSLHVYKRFCPPSLCCGLPCAFTASTQIACSALSGAARTTQTHGVHVGVELELSLIPKIYKQILVIST